MPLVACVVKDIFNTIRFPADGEHFWISLSSELDDKRLYWRWICAKLGSSRISCGNWLHTLRTSLEIEPNTTEFVADDDELDVTFVIFISGYSNEFGVWYSCSSSLESNNGI